MSRPAFHVVTATASHADAVAAETVPDPHDLVHVIRRGGGEHWIQLGNLVVGHGATAGEAWAAASSFFWRSYMAASPEARRHDTTPDLAPALCRATGPDRRVCVARGSCPRSIACND
jgi:hypothetical protein